MARIRKTANIRSLEFTLLDYGGGTNTMTNERRLAKKYASVSSNLEQFGDGTWRTRPGTTFYGEAVTSATNIDGAVEYINGTDVRELILVAGGFAWKSVDGGTWTQLTGATYTAGIAPYFMQIKGRLYITNGVDPLSYYDGTTIHTYTQINAPSSVTATLQGGLTSGSYTNSYRVEAVNDIGNTTPSVAPSGTDTNKHRDTWSSGEGISLSWTAVSGANAYQVYWGEFAGEEVLLGETSTNSFTDDGSYTPNPYIETTDDNQTGAPKFRSMEISGNRMWGTYDPDHPSRVYFSGTGQYMGYFSPFYGGGYIDLEAGSRNKPVAVVHYRTGKGDPSITVLCSSPDGRGTIFQVSLTTITVGDVTFSVPYAQKIVGSIGAESPFGVVKVGDNIMFMNRRGVYSLKNKQQIFNVLATEDDSAIIRPSYESLNSDRVAEFSAYYSAPNVYFLAGTGATNNRTFLYNTERRNWAYAWTISFKRMLEYTDSSGTVHLLGIPNSGNRLVEITASSSTDLGEPFSQSYKSGILPITRSSTDIVHVKEAIYELGNFTGVVTLGILGTREDNIIKSYVTKEVVSTSSSSSTGIGVHALSNVLLSYGEGLPVSTAQSVTKIRVPINKSLFAVQVQVASNESNTYWELLSVQLRGTISRRRAPLQWT